MKGARKLSSTNVRMPDNTKEQVMTAAEANHWSMNTWINVAIQEKLERTAASNKTAAVMSI